MALTRIIRHENHELLLTVDEKNMVSIDWIGMPATLTLTMQMILPSLAMYANSLAVYGRKDPYMFLAVKNDNLGETEHIVRWAKRIRSYKEDVYTVVEHVMMSIKANGKLAKIDSFLYDVLDWACINFPRNMGKSAYGKYDYQMQIVPKVSNIVTKEQLQRAGFRFPKVGGIN